MKNLSSAESAGQKRAGSTSRSTSNDLCPTSIQTLQIRVREAEKLLTELLRQHQDGAIPDWELLRGLPGMRLEPMSWEEAAKVVGDGSPVALARLGRMPLQSKQYREFRDGVILKKYVSVTDYLYATVFGLECEREFESHGRERALVPVGFHLGDPVIVWRLNDFPYAFESGIEHHVLWASQPLNHERIQEEAARHKPPDQYEWIYFVNPTVLKSVPAIWHAHIISRKLIQ